MKISPLFASALFGVLAIVTVTLIVAKPSSTAIRKDPSTPAPPPAPPAAPVEPDGIAAVARWLVRPDAQPDAILLPFAQVIRAATGKTAIPFDAANKADSATLVKIGAVLDQILPRMNQPGSSAHAAAAFGNSRLVAACFEEELRGALGVAQPATANDRLDRTYPAFFLAGSPDGKAYYLAVTLYPEGHEPAAPALTISAGIAAGRMSADGCCLLVGIEQNGKLGPAAAFLNWKVSDLTRANVRFRPVFEASRDDALQPAAVLADGRKGRD